MGGMFRGTLVEKSRCHAQPNHGTERAFKFVRGGDSLVQIMFIFAHSIILGDIRLWVGPRIEIFSSRDTSPESLSLSTATEV